MVTSSHSTAAMMSMQLSHSLYGSHFGIFKCCRRPLTNVPLNAVEEKAEITAMDYRGTGEVGEGINECIIIVFNM